MKAPYKIIALFFALVFLSVGCSRKKNTFVSRNYHALTAKDNALYNGYLALEKGKTAVVKSFHDNYWDILPIERLEVFEEITLPGQSKNADFERAEEKAAKAIQKHSINIKGKEYNAQMDEAYLLLGKSRYFDQRFIPALAAFNNILNKYPTSDKINQVKIWKAKTNLRLENEELAIENLKRLLKDEALKGQDLADATSTLAQAYINTKSLDTAITQLGIASKATKNNDERGRYRFIQGQLYNKLGYKDSANMAFDRVIELNRRTPRIYLVTAQLEKINNFDFENGNKLELYEHLKELEENRENRPYLDKIYYQTAVFHLRDGSDSLAVAYYNKALRTASQDKLLKAHAYETLGNLSFDKAEYKIAGAYYDSTMNNLTINTKPYRIIKKKRENLEDVIYYEAIATANDSILDLVAMSDNEREAYFADYVENLIAKREKIKEQKEIEERNKGFKSPSFGPRAAKNNLSNPPTLKRNNNTALPGAGGASTAANFYFYNPSTVAYGKTEFSKKWGDRSLEDNWRWASRVKSNVKNEEIETPIEEEVAEDETLDLQYYISKIPSGQKEIDSILRERNDAYYQLAIIYKEKFKKYQLSKSRYKELLASNPDEKYIVPSKYNLYKVYEALGENSEAEAVKNDIISNYPETRYAQILKHPELAASNGFETPENIYDKLYAQFENQEYKEVIEQCEENIKVLEGDPMVPKFELLKATASGKLYGYEAYAKGINHVALTYPNTEEGKQAIQISTEALPQLAENTFVQDSLIANYKTVFKFDYDDTEKLAAFKKDVDKEAKEVTYYNLTTSVDVYDPHTRFLIVHGLISESTAKGFVERLEKSTKKKVTTPYFVISSDNYRVIQIHKNLEDYLNREAN